MANEPIGYLALVLHAHLPFVRHPEHEKFLEEDWLFEAITETYLPLLDLMEGWNKDNVEWKLTMSLTPSLCSMLQDSLLQERYVNHLKRLIELSEKEIQRHSAQPAFRNLAEAYFEQFNDCLQKFDKKHDRDVLAAFKYFMDTGNLEIITCSATHGFMPLMQHNMEAVRAQVSIGVEHYAKTFGRRPRGIWNAECGFFPGLDEVLNDNNLRFFFCDSHALLLASRLPQYGVFAPMETPGGPVAFARDQESSKSVWSAEHGYPGDASYREFYRDIGFDLDMDYLRAYLHNEKDRAALGIKYYKITGNGVPLPEKEIYNAADARLTAERHAGHFLFCRQQQALHLQSLMPHRPPLITSPYDAELFGHWWYEGPQFLDFLVRKIHFDQDEIEMITPIDYLDKHPENQLAMPSMSSWGYGGFSEVWLEGSNDWIYRHLDQAAVRMRDLANANTSPDAVLERTLNQCARELLLAQSSDWAFIMKTNTVVDYAVKRTKTHLIQFNKLADMIEAEEIDANYLESLEWKDNLFEDLDYRVYQTRKLATSS